MSDMSFARDLIAQIHAADRALDVERFLTLLSPHVRMQIGSQPEMQGHAAVRAVITPLFQAMQGIDHVLKELWVRERSVVFRAEVTYTLRLRDATDVISVPYVDVLHLAPDDRVEDYRIFIDLAPVMAKLGESASQHA